MKPSLRTGATGTSDFAVGEEHTIRFAPALPAMLSTPALLWFLEQAAIRALEPGLEAGEISLGTEVNIQHLAPSPSGSPIRCVARLLQADGNQFLFQVEARDERGLIARGTHRRVVVSADRLARKLAR
ncbi:MAG: thioesterase family protein [Verrucomicrobiales bacterium]|nr:thioesterase family protein [Verrucomicrobiales bacterium]MCP5527975.1 thioesterase family protein [Verrucomicrobiales bacterium]